MSNKDFHNIVVTFMKYWNVVWDNVRKDFNLVFGNAGGSRRMGLILEQRYKSEGTLYYFLYYTRLDLLQVQLQTFTVENFHFEDFCEQHDYKQAMR